MAEGQDWFEVNVVIIERLQIGSFISMFGGVFIWNWDLYVIQNLRETKIIIVGFLKVWLSQL